MLGPLPSPSASWKQGFGILREHENQRQLELTQLIQSLYFTGMKSPRLGEVQLCVQGHTAHRVPKD